METLTGQMRGFADACHDNALDELREALMGPVDEVDCLAWNLTENEWRRAIAVAIA